MARGPALPHGPVIPGQVTLGTGDIRRMPPKRPPPPHLRPHLRRRQCFRAQPRRRP